VGDTPVISTAGPCNLTVLANEKLFLEALPESKQYESSYMHRDSITHIVVTK
jgi:peptidylprolyl isomerase domain and WD repeat-containing protein 1